MTRTHLNKIKVVKGNIVDQQVDMIVNAANRKLIMGKGVDQDIHFACQPEMDKLKEELVSEHAKSPYAGKDLPDGEVLVTHTFGKLKNNAQCRLCGKILK